MTTFHDNIRAFLEDVERFVVKTLPKENLSTAAVHHKQCLILKIKDIRVKYGTQLNLQGELLQGTDNADTITPKGGSPGEKGLASEKRGSPSSSRNKAAVIPPTEEDEEFYDDVLHPPETSKANEENQIPTMTEEEEEEELYDEADPLPQRGEDKAGIAPMTEEEEEFYDDGISPQIPPRDGKDEEVNDDNISNTSLRRGHDDSSLHEDSRSSLHDESPYQDSVMMARDVPVAELTNPTKQGYLDKKRKKDGGTLLIISKISPYQKRWCVIKNNSFYYYEKPSDRKQAGAFSLLDYEGRPSASKKENFVFELVCPGKRTYQFLAGYKEEMDEWIAAVNKESKFSGFSSPSIDLPPTPETHAKDGAGAPVVNDDDEEMYEVPGEVTVQEVKVDPKVEEEIIEEEQYEDTELIENPSKGTPVAHSTLAPDEDDELYDDNLQPPSEASDDIDEIYDECLVSNAMLTTQSGMMHAASVSSIPSYPPPQPPPSARIAGSRTSISSSSSSDAYLPPRELQTPSTDEIKRKFTPNRSSLHSKILPKAPIAVSPKEEIKEAPEQEEDYENIYFGLWDCCGDDDNELTFKRGEVIRVISKEHEQLDWWVGVLNGKVGLVPKAYLMEAYELRVE